MVDVTLLTPAIRTPRWKSFYESAKKACKKYEFEIMFISPFKLPEELQGLPEVKLIQDYGCPSRATEIGVEAATGTFLYNCVDDGVFYENCIDDALDFFNSKCMDTDIINMRYRESTHATRDEFPLSYWEARPNGLSFPGVREGWKIALHFLMKKNLYQDLGGIDCAFEYVNHSIHDLVFRAQAKGSVVHMSPTEGLNCTHYEGTTGDHAPIHNAQLGHDEPLFRQLYEDIYASVRHPVTFTPWHECDAVWSRRFGYELPLTYEDL